MIGTSGSEDNPDWERYYTPENVLNLERLEKSMTIDLKKRIQVGTMFLKVNKMPGSNVKPV